MSTRNIVFTCILCTIAGIVLGAAAMFTFSTSLLSSANSSRDIADVTTDVTVLERIEESDLTTVRQIVSSRLQSSLVGLSANSESLSSSQRAEFEKLQSRAARYVNDMGKQ